MRLVDHSPGCPQVGVFIGRVGGVERNNLLLGSTGAWLLFMFLKALALARTGFFDGGGRLTSHQLISGLRRSFTAPESCQSNPLEYGAGRCPFLAEGRLIIAIRVSDDLNNAFVEQLDITSQVVPTNSKPVSGG